MTEYRHGRMQAWHSFLFIYSKEIVNVWRSLMRYVLILKCIGNSGHLHIKFTSILKKKKIVTIVPK